MALPTLTGTARIISDTTARTGASGKPWLPITLLFTSKRQEPDGKWVDADSFVINAVAFGPLATNIAASCAKGDELHVTGSVKTNTWTDKDGTEQSRPQLVLDTAALSLRWNPAKVARKPRDASGPANGRPSAGRVGAQRSGRPDEVPWPDEPPPY